MYPPLSPRERLTQRVLVWSDWLLVVLTFLVAWNLNGVPQPAKDWPDIHQFLFRLLTSIAVVIAVLSMRSHYPFGMIVNFAGLVPIAAARTGGFASLWLSLTGCLMICGMLLGAMIQTSLNGRRLPAHRLDTNRNYSPSAAGRGERGK